MSGHIHLCNTYFEYFFNFQVSLEPKSAQRGRTAIFYMSSGILVENFGKRIVTMTSQNRAVNDKAGTTQTGVSAHLSPESQGGQTGTAGGQSEGHDHVPLTGQREGGQGRLSLYEGHGRGRLVGQYDGPDLGHRGGQFVGPGPGLQST